MIYCCPICRCATSWPDPQHYKAGAGDASALRTQPAPGDSACDRRGRWVRDKVAGAELPRRVLAPAVCSAVLTQSTAMGRTGGDGGEAQAPRDGDRTGDRRGGRGYAARSELSELIVTPAVRTTVERNGTGMPESRRDGTEAKVRRDWRRGGGVRGGPISKLPRAVLPPAECLTGGIEGARRCGIHGDG